jgi:hypothetical protein
MLGCAQKLRQVGVDLLHTMKIDINYGKASKNIEETGPGRSPFIA